MNRDRTSGSRERFAATVSRQFSLWPFGMSTLRMYLLVDPSDGEPGLATGMLRAMQQEYFRSEARSQTNAVRSVILAAHYVLRHRNSDALPHERVTAAAGCLVARGTTAYVALAGEVAAFSWNGERLQTHRSTSRAARPLGADAPPRVTFWSAPLGPGDRLAMVCGAPWDGDTVDAVEDVLRRVPPGVASEALADQLASSGGPVRAVVADGPPTAARERAADGPAGARHVRGASSAHARSVAASRPPRRTLSMALPLLMMAALVGIVVAVNPFAEPRSVALARQAEADLDAAARVTDAYQAHALVASAVTLARAAAATAPDKYTPLREASDRTLAQVDRVSALPQSLVVRLGPASANLADIAVSPTSLFALDVADGTIRRYTLDAADQAPTADTLLLRQGTPVNGAPLDTPVAMTYVRDPGGTDGRLVVIDRARTAVEVRDDGTLARRPMPGMSWTRLSALSAGTEGALYILDGDDAMLLAYPFGRANTGMPPHPVLTRTDARTLPFDHVVGLLAEQDLYVITDDGRLQRFDRQGQALPFDVRAPDGALGPVSGVASDANGALYLADPSQQRLVEATADGRFVRQFRGASSLGSLRSLQLSPDGGRLFGVSAEGVVALSLPSDVPPPLQPPPAPSGLPSGAQSGQPTAGPAK